MPMFFQLLLISLVFTACSKNESSVPNVSVIEKVEEKASETNTAEVEPDAPVEVQEPIEYPAQLLPFISDSPYVKKLLICSYPDTEEKSCVVKELPLLEMNPQKISVNDILNRTLVTHQFLGEKFKQVLLKMPPETLALFGAVNGIVISSEVSTNAYWARSGFIYLSARLFCRSKDECQTLSKENDIQKLPVKFVNDYIYNQKSIWDESIQDDQILLYKVAATLFHELAHANDYFEPSYVRSNDFAKEKSYDELTFERMTVRQMVSQRMPGRPSSVRLEHLAGIIYKNEEIKDEDLTLTPQSVVDEFLTNNTNDLYSHINHEEDMARLVEEALILTYFNIPRLIVFTDKSNSIVYAEKNRVAQPNLRTRVLYVIEKGFSKSVADKVKEKLEDVKPVVFPANSSWNQLYQQVRLKCFYRHE